MIKSIVLIPTILSVLLPTLPSGNNFNPPIQNADPVSIIAWDIDDATRLSEDFVIPNYSYVYQTVAKYNTTKSNNYISIKETTYSATVNYNITPNHDIYNYIVSDNIRYRTSALTITEITTYSGITNNEINYEISLLNNNSVVQTPILIDIHQFKTNNDLSSYINILTYAQINSPFKYYTDIVNNYSMTNTQTLDNDEIDETYLLSTDIQLNNIWKTYIITYVEYDQTIFRSLTGNGDLFTIENGEILGITTITGGYEVIDIPSLMFTILTLPFSFITQAFNLTLFPNTPYSINIGNLFLSIVAIILLMWLLQKIIGFFSKS